MSDHTPGPWYHMGGVQPQIASEADPRGRTLALVYGNVANADLIAAAPDLLDALENLIDRGLIRDAHNDHYDQCVLAIEKARGS